MTFLALFLVFFSYLLYFCPLVQSVGREFAGINIKRDKGMKLAEALSIRKDLQKRIQQLGEHPKGFAEAHPTAWAAHSEQCKGTRGR